MTGVVTGDTAQGALLGSSQNPGRGDSGAFNCCACGSCWPCPVLESKEVFLRHLPAAPVLVSPCRTLLYVLSEILPPQGRRVESRNPRTLPLNDFAFTRPHLGARGLHPSLPEGRVHKELEKKLSNHFTECLCAYLDVNLGHPEPQACGRRKREWLATQNLRLGEGGKGSGWVLVFHCVSLSAPVSWENPVLVHSGHSWLV